MMPFQPILIVEIFDIQSIYFMGPFPSFYGNVYILVVMDYVSKSVKASVTKTNNHKVVMKFIQDFILCQYGTPRALISDYGWHFLYCSFEVLPKKYLVRHK